MVKKCTKDEFIHKARAVHGGKYVYDDFEYVNAITKGKIICPIHGEFLQSANVHLSGHGCPRCARENYKKVGKLSFGVFEERARKVHGDKYVYIPSNIRNNKDKVNIICPTHGEFWQSAALHLSGQGCPKCAQESKREKMSNGLQSFIEEACKVHDSRYDYSKVEYVNNKTKVCIICPTHGEFWQKPFDHIIGKKGCPKCVGRSLTLQDFEERARKVHGDKYEYLEYTMSDAKARIKCNICGHEFVQKGWSHLQGHGCPFCNSSKLENEVRLLLERNKIESDEQKTFDWLKLERPLKLDFYLPNHGIAIECQGKQHFPNSRNFGGKDKYEEINFRDGIKKRLCDEHNIDLVYFTHENVCEYMGKFFTDANDLMDYILSKKTK